jgi:hypothetical protein
MGQYFFYAFLFLVGGWCGLVTMKLLIRPRRTPNCRNYDPDDFDYEQHRRMICPYPEDSGYREVDCVPHRTQGWALCEVYDTCPQRFRCLWTGPPTGAADPKPKLLRPLDSSKYFGEVRSC